MKKRNGFVTNSSSSSFIITFKMDFQKGQTIELIAEEDNGDYEDRGLSFRAKDKDGAVIAKEEFSLYELLDDEPYECEYMCDFPVHYDSFVGLCKATSTEQFFDTLTKSFGLTDIDFNEYEDEDEDEYGWELKEEREAVENALIEIKDCVNNVFEKHIAKMDDLCLNTMSLEFEFGGRGECLQDVFEIAEKVFGYECAEEIGSYYDEFDETDDSDLFFDNLRQMKELKLLTDKSIETLVNFFVECEWAPDLCTITLKRANDNQIEMIIDWE